MRKRNIGWVITSVVVTTVLGLGAAGCGKGKADTTANNKKVKTVVVGSGNSYVPYAYLDEDGKAVGYEYDVLAAIDELLPEYEFQYENMSFDNLLLSLDAGKIGVAAHQYEYTKERSEKYLFSTESYTKYTTYITVLDSNNEIKGIDDLAGKRVLAGGTTSATNQILTNYNKEHPERKIEIVNEDSSSNEQTVSQLKSGAIDATVSENLAIAKINKEFGGGKALVKAVGEPINDTNTYYVFKKGNTELQTAFDGALKKLKENGKLAELSKKWLGADYTK